MMLQLSCAVERLSDSGPGIRDQGPLIWVGENCLSFLRDPCYDYIRIQPQTPIPFSLRPLWGYYHEGASSGFKL